MIKKLRSVVQKYFKLPWYWRLGLLFVLMILFPLVYSAFVFSIWGGDFKEIVYFEYKAMLYPWGIMGSIIALVGTHDHES